MSANLIHLDDDNFAENTKTGLTLVDFYATWCGPCRMIAPIVEQLADKFQGKVRVAKMDTDEAQQTTASLQITSIPTLILFKDGKELKRIVGVKDMDFLSNLLQSYTQ